MILAVKIFLALFAMFVIAALVALGYGAAKIRSEVDDNPDQPLGKY